MFARHRALTHWGFRCAQKHGWFLCHQFETEANWKFHEATTGPEILNDLKCIDSKLDYSN